MQKIKLHSIAGTPGGKTLWLERPVENYNIGDAHILSTKIHLNYFLEKVYCYLDMIRADFRLRKANNEIENILDIYF